MNIAMFAVAPGEVMKFLQSQLVAGYQQGGAQVRQVSFGTGTLRAVPLSAQEIAAIMRTQHTPTPTALPHQ
jgi:hypothetical protein